MSQQPEETVGLDLFDETASAAGSFPHSMLGYERQAVDAYIRDIERQLSSAKRKVRSLQRQVSNKEAETDLSKLGDHARDVMRAAEAEGAELRNQARLDAERIVAQAAHEAEALAHNTHAETTTHRAANLDDLNRLREELAGQTGAELEAARQEAQLLRDAAENHRKMIVADAERNAAALRDQAALDADQVRQAAQKEAADVRAKGAAEHAQALEALQQRQHEVTSQLGQLSEQARLQSEQFGTDMAHQVELMNSRRNAALSESDKIVADADDRARAIVAEARAAAAKREREAGLAEADKISKLNEEIARLSVRHAELQKILRSLSQMATSSFGDLPADEGASQAGAGEPAAAPANDTTAVEAPQPVDDDATRVQPAASGGTTRR
ncbi:MAG: DivIVA domain-containing protein [Micropruina sp.]|nr:DivIVA domain-containing protein [Micropruina sp.]